MSPRMIGVAAPSASRPSTSTSGPPIMKSVWTPETFTPSSRSSIARRGSASADGMPRSEGDVAGRVLVEERVAEVSPVRLHGRGPVDERDLAEVAAPARPTASCSRMISAPARGRRRRRCARPRTGPRDRRPRAGRHERLRRADEALGAPPVRRREDLFGRHVRDVRDPGRGLERRAAPASGGMRPIVRSVSGPRNRTASKARSFSASARAWSIAACSRHAATGSGSSSRSRVGHGVPESLEVRLSEDLRRPAFVRRGDDRPVHVPRSRRSRAWPAAAPSARPDRRAPDRGRRAGPGRVPGQRDDGRVLLVPAPNPVEQVRRRPAELLLGPELDRRPAQVEIE